MSHDHARQLREIIEDTQNVARGLFLAYDKLNMTAHTYHASLAAVHMHAFRRLDAIISELEQ